VLHFLTTEVIFSQIVMVQRNTWSNHYWITITSHWYCFRNVRLQSCVIKQTTL